MIKQSPFKYFKTSPEIIRLAVMLYIRFPLSLRNVEDLLRERGIDVSHEFVRYPQYERGITDVDGLYFCGLHWMHSQGSGLFYGVGEDAEYVVDHLISTSNK
ncbi:putative oxidoreductase CzcO [Ruegeria atlantica]|uniref:Putative oxidoreductase CzcO n=1 Tax=Ruegeria atlantica TaxID=81569 RepID=A0A0P1EAZ1_9RHOB|nr:putative oxidoreductase CzcO [Ruegeria atlantica]